MSAEMIERAVQVADTYGDEVLERLLDLAPLVAATGKAWRQALAAVLDGDNGTLVVHVPGLPGDPPRATWMGEGWRVMAELHVPLQADPPCSTPEGVRPLETVRAAP